MMLFKDLIWDTMFHSVPSYSPECNNFSDFPCFDDLDCFEAYPSVFGRMALHWDLPDALLITEPG